MRNLLPLFFIFAAQVSFGAPPFQWNFEGIELSELKKFAQAKTAIEAVAALRNQYSFKVYILESTPNPFGLRRTPGLLNLPEDEVSAQFYGQLKYGKTPRQNSGYDLGQYLAPYEYGLTVDPKLPSIDHHRVFLAPFATRDTIIHEFVHYLLYRTRGEGLVKCGRAQTPCTFHTAVIANYVAAERLQAKDLAHELQYKARYLEAGLYQGEELAVAKIILSHADELSFSKDERFYAKSYAVNRYSKFAEFLKEFTSDPKLKGSATLAQAQDNQKRLKVFETWYNAEGRRK